MNERSVIIIGSGPAGLTAAIYSARANMKPLVFEGAQSGGQLMITTEVENYPGFRDGITGPELIAEFRAQAERFGTEFITADITKVELKTTVKTVWEGDKKTRTKSIIIATGARAKLLGLENEMKLMGRGVSACATCDGFFFQDKKVGVIGGGDSAMDEAIFLTTYASKVYIIHRRDKFRASNIMVRRANKNSKIEFILNHEIIDILGDETVRGIKIKDKNSKKVSELAVNGVFIAIGHTPNTKLFEGQLELDEKGYIKTSNDKSSLSATNIPGVFACGDVQDSHYRQAVTIVGCGAIAAIDAKNYLETRKI